MKKLIFLAVLVAVLPAPAVIYTTNWTVNAAIPDGNLSGWASSQSVSTMPAGTLQGVAVMLNITGGWNGDLYAYLVHGSGFSVLLDRVGPGTYGYGDAGFNNILLADTGAGFGTPQGNINNYQTVLGGPGVPGGIWNPDNTLGSLGSFAGTSANGSWTLFVADLSAGSVSTVQSWGLQMDIVAVPEVETWAAAALAGAFGAFWLNRQIWGTKRPV